MAPAAVKYILVRLAPLALLLSSACVHTYGRRSVPRLTEGPPAGTFFCPLNHPSVLSPYGMRHGKLHEGIDIRTGRKSGQPVFASRDGRVMYAAKKGWYGKMILILHDDGYKTRYAHLSRIRVRPGENVAGGDFIGNVGRTGNASGPHLHFEIITPGGVPINPAPYIFHKKS